MDGPWWAIPPYFYKDFLWNSKKPEGRREGKPQSTQPPPSLPPSSFLSAFFSLIELSLTSSFVTQQRQESPPASDRVSQMVNTEAAWFNQQLLGIDSMKPTTILAWVLLWTNGEKFTQLFVVAYTQFFYKRQCESSTSNFLTLCLLFSYSKTTQKCLVVFHSLSLINSTACILVPAGGFIPLQTSPLWGSKMATLADTHMNDPH